MEASNNSNKPLRIRNVGLCGKVVDYDEGMCDQEVIEHILIGTVSRRDARSIAKGLTNKFGSLGNIISADPRDLMAIDELNDAGVAALKIVKLAASRLLKSEICNRNIFNSWDRLMDYLHAELARERDECIRCLFLDRKYRLISIDSLVTGTIQRVAVHPRTIVKRALDLNASYLVIAHNHPSGDPKASPEDIQITMILKQSLWLVDLELIDHVIIGNGAYWSFRQQGWLSSEHQLTTS